MKALVIGAGGKIGSALVKTLAHAGHTVTGTTRKDLDLRNVPDELLTKFGHQDVAYICAAMTRFVDCEDNHDAYRVNVDGPIALAKQLRCYGKVVYLSSEAVERCLHTNYGMHKALAEIGLQAICAPVIARLSKVDPWSMDQVCEFLVSLADAPEGIYRWSAKPVVNVQALAA